LEAPAHPTANTEMAEEISAGYKLYRAFVKWSRRLSAVVIWVLIVRWITGAGSPITQIATSLAPVLTYFEPLPLRRSAIALLMCWYALLTQMTIRWALWLPGYFAVYAPWLITKCVVKLLVLLFKIVGKTVAFAAAPLFKQLESIGETPVNAASE